MQLLTQNAQRVALQSKLWGVLSGNFTGKAGNKKHIIRVPLSALTTFNISIQMFFPRAVEWVLTFWELPNSCTRIFQKANLLAFTCCSRALRAASVLYYVAREGKKAHTHTKGNARALIWLIFQRWEREKVAPSRIMASISWPAELKWWNEYHSY